jgi:bifunctional non-homologous end joining protein LigD
VYEEKVDGYRMLAYNDGRKVRLVSRSGVDHTPRYPNVAAAIRQLPPKMLMLDGEVADLRPAAPIAVRVVARGRT